MSRRSDVRRLAVAAVALLVATAHADDVPLVPGEIVIADRGGRGIAGALYRLPPGGVPRPIATTEPLGMPSGVAVDRDGTLVVAEARADEPGRIVRVDPATGAVVTLAGGWPLITPIGIALEESGDVLVADLDDSRLDFPRGSLAGTGAIYRVPRASGVPALLRPRLLPLERRRRADAGRRARLVDLGFRVFEGDGASSSSSTTGVQRAIATSIAPRSLRRRRGWARSSSPEPQSTGRRRDPRRRAAHRPVTVLATGHPITDPRGIAIDPTGDLVVADSAARAVYRITRPDRHLAVLATTPLFSPWGVAIAP